MRFITCRTPDGSLVPAILSPDGNTVWPLRWLGLPAETLAEAIPLLTPQVRAGLSLALGGIPGIPREAVQLDSPIPHPVQDVICLGINYLSHSEEAERYSAQAFAAPHTDAIYFSKRVSRAVPDGAAIPPHTRLVKKLDYECELAVVLGQDARDLTPGHTQDAVFGYTILNDVSARDQQTAHKQWYFGKSLDGFAPMGPCIVTADEFDTYPPRLGLRCWVNDQLRQDANTAQQIHRHPRRRGHGDAAPLFFAARRRGPLRDRGHWDPDQPGGRGRSGVRVQLLKVFFRQHFAIRY